MDDIREHPNFKKWIAELRSGRRVQITGTLRGRTDDGEVGECCLGVACDLSDVGEWTPFGDYEPHEGSPNDATLPLAVARWLGLDIAVEFDDGIDPYFDIPDVYLDRSRGGLPYIVTCASANDDLGLTFDQIADLAEYFGVYYGRRS